MPLIASDGSDAITQTELSNTRPGDSPGMLISGYLVPGYPVCIRILPERRTGYEEPTRPYVNLNMKESVCHNLAAFLVLT